MPRYARKGKGFRRKSGYRKRTTGASKRSIYRINRRLSAVSRRIAGEVCKFESVPSMFGNRAIVVGTSNTGQFPLNTISSGVPFIYPINWIYTQPTGSASSPIYVDGIDQPNGTALTASFKNPIWYNTLGANRDVSPQPTGLELLSDISPGLQYRLKYIYINALFNASISSSVNNTDGALRIVIVKDKQPTGGAATWADTTNIENSRGVFNANRINAQLNPNTVGRFKIMYDKTLHFSTTNGYKPFKYFKKLSTVVRNNRDLIPDSNFVSTNVVYNNLNTTNSLVQSSAASPPVQKNAFYLMMFSDGLDFTYSSSASTPAAGFNLFCRVAYYNN